VSSVADAVQEAVEHALVEAPARRGGNRRAPLKRLPDGTFAPRGMGRVLEPRDLASLPTGGTLKMDGGTKIKRDSDGGLRVHMGNASVPAKDAAEAVKIANQHEGAGKAKAAGKAARQENAAGNHIVTLPDGSEHNHGPGNKGRIAADAQVKAYERAQAKRAERKAASGSGGAKLDSWEQDALRRAGKPGGSHSYAGGTPAMKDAMRRLEKKGYVKLEGSLGSSVKVTLTQKGKNELGAQAGASMDMGGGSKGGSFDVGDYTVSPGGDGYVVKDSKGNITTTHKTADEATKSAQRFMQAKAGSGELSKRAGTNKSGGAFTSDQAAAAGKAGKAAGAPKSKLAAATAAKATKVDDQEAAQLKRAAWSFGAHSQRVAERELEESGGDLIKFSPEGLNSLRSAMWELPESSSVFKKFDAAYEHHFGGKVPAGAPAKGHTAAIMQPSAYRRGTTTTTYFKVLGYDQDGNVQLGSASGSVITSSVSKIVTHGKDQSEAMKALRELRNQGKTQEGELADAVGDALVEALQEAGVVHPARELLAQIRSIPASPEMVTGRLSNGVSVTWMGDSATYLVNGREYRTAEGAARAAAGEEVVEEGAIQEGDPWGGKPGINHKQVGADARKKLGPLVRHYMKQAHPFTSCVNDNTKRFGKDRAERVCAVLKDVGKGTTKWRKGGKVSEADVDAVIDALVEAGLECREDVELIEAYMLAQMPELERAIVEGVYAS
jgi:hypothetical protein